MSIHRFFALLVLQIATSNAAIQSWVIKLTTTTTSAIILITRKTPHPARRPLVCHQTGLPSTITTMSLGNRIVRRTTMTIRATISVVSCAWFRISEIGERQVDAWPHWTKYRTACVFDGSECLSGE